MSSKSNQWLFSQNDMAKTPTILDGMPWENERILRAKGGNFIINAGMTLKLPPTTIYTAGIYFQRFYMRHSFRTYHHYDLAGTCLFLASKEEETGRRLRDVVTISVRKARKDDAYKVDENSDDFRRWKETILYHEELVLETLCFDLNLELPYSFLFEILARCAATPKQALSAIAFTNDFIKTPLCLMYPPQVLAGVSVFLSSQVMQETLFEVKSGKAWWEISTADTELIQDAVETLYVSVMP
ncbi:cyclin-like protein [Basidiobolus meristosporus CBS 931.73]|uniref:Cyclin-like protein n=1 Tax=Basidiobolus meristosporus CBS 931.73 TaxID=1314790 RepID=A0A1Y1XP62_9FUNG|nr:cyclin-like protein [Basidiobolus meristosporus CBS 931.73]ORX90510.1 cyclin-like protein [Basidiobolus meristosporus CBS 931.73]|eukprot:ORX87521.1 cyclin-like protein [Basidiobolus meristosporus CBS 931.73]